MRSSKLLLAILVLLPLALSACGGGGGGGPAVPVVISLTVTPANPTITTGSTQQFTATAVYSNNLSVDVTASATWSSSNTAVATVSNTSGSKGSVTAGSIGTTTVIASYSGHSGGTTLQVTGSDLSTGAPNVMAITVNGSLCSPYTSLNYMNKPCVSVKVCVPGDPTNCQTINDILLDTGSYGLRIFKQTASSALGLPAAFTSLLPQVRSDSGSLVSCVQFADGSSLWGPIQRATVILGNEPGVTIPIQVVDSTFAPSTNTNCAVVKPAPYLGPDRTPLEAGFTGILGVGLLQQDCGDTCVGSADNGKYYSCTGSGCTGATVPLSDQVANPVAALPVDNNGLIVQLATVPELIGLPSLTGTLTLGIGTAPDNAPGSPVVIQTDPVGNFTTTAFSNGATEATFTDSFLDTGSNANFIPPATPLLPPCSGGNLEWYCPPITRHLLATVSGHGGSPSTPVAFTVSNAVTIFGINNNVSIDLAGTSSFGFDWGMPFHMNRRVFYGIEKKATPALGATGPFVGF